MIPIRYKIALSAGALLLSGVPHVRAQARSIVRAKTYGRVDGVQYARGKAAPLLADMYLPTQSGLRPAIVFVHGGGWTGGSRTGWSKLIAPFAEQGYVGMAVDYDLSPAVRFPTALEECKEAVRWLRAHADEYHVDPERIAIAGGSAGGELAALVALTGDDRRYEGSGGYRNFSSSVKAAILTAPIWISPNSLKQIARSWLTLGVHAPTGERPACKLLRSFT